MTTKQLEEALTRAYRMGAASVKAPDLIGHIQAEFAGSVLDQCAKAEQQHQWQPIKTAPKDGTHILAWTDASDTAYVVCWADAAEGIRKYLTAESGAERGWHLAWDGTLFDREYEPTLWMPLPANPINAGRT